MIQLAWTSGFNKGQRHNLSLFPCPAIMAGGLGGSGHGQYELIEDGEPDTNKQNMKPEYKVLTMAEIDCGQTTGLKVASTFSGGGGSCTGYKMSGFDVAWANEFVPSAQESYRANHPSTHLDCRDIKTVLPEEILAACGLKVGELDLFDGSPPCFPAGTKITTEFGPCNIEDVAMGMRVLTHNGNFRPVMAKMAHHHTGNMVTIGTKYGRKWVSATAEHPFYVKAKLPGRAKRYAQPSFIEAKEVKAGDLLLEPFTKDGSVAMLMPTVIVKVRGETRGQSGRDGFKMRLEERPCELSWRTFEMAWLLGFYLAEGHRRGKNPTLKDKGSCRRETLFSVHIKESAVIARKLQQLGLKTCVTKSRGQACRITVTSLDFWALCGVMGHGAKNKFIPELFHAMPRDWQAAFVDGYYSGDGCYNKSNRVNSTCRKATTVSWGIATGIARMSARVAGVVAQVKVAQLAGVDEIEGRKVNRSETYQVGYTLPVEDGRNRPGHVDADGAWVPVVSTMIQPGNCMVYNFEVAVDNSYVAEGFAVHNCQAFSTAGKREKGWAVNGGTGKQYEGGEVQHNELLFFEYVRLVKGLQPKVFIAENVKGLTMGAAKEMMGDSQTSMFGGEKFVTKDGQEVTATKDEDTILHALMDAGYVVRWKVLDAKNYGVPQTRNRVIFIGIRKDLAHLVDCENLFPPKLDYVYTVRDALPWITKAIHDTSGAFSDGDITDKAASCVMAGRSGTHQVEERVVHDMQSAKFQRGGKGDVTDEPAPAITDGQRGAQLHVEKTITEIPAHLKLPPSRQKADAYGEAVDVDKPCPTVTCASPGNDLQVSQDLPTVIKIDNEHFKQQPGNSFPRGKEFSVDEVAPSVQAKGMYGAPMDVVKIVQQQGGTFNAEVSTEKPLPCVCASQPNQFVIHEQSIEKVEVIMGNEKFKPIFGDPASGPCPTIMAGGPHGGSGMVQVTKQEAGAIKTEKRKFTIAEVKRICAFPDDYILAGSYAKQWERLGNSVPPVLMMHIAQHLRDHVFAKFAPLTWSQRPPRPSPEPPKAPEPKPEKPAKSKAIMKSSADWQAEMPQIKVMDPDGWDRTNFEASWAELITKKEYLARRERSTVMSIKKPKASKSAAAPEPPVGDPKPKIGKSSKAKAKKAPEQPQEPPKPVQTAPAPAKAEPKGTMDNKWVDYWKNRL